MNYQNSRLDPNINTLERCQKRGLSNFDFTGLALHEDSRITYEDLDIEDSITITRLADFTKTQRCFIAPMRRPVAGCDYPRYFEAYTGIAAKAQRRSA